MRPIKFRCWDNENKEWLEDDTLLDFTGQLCRNESMIMEGDFELMQFTGLLDKNGVEIFEGDIVHNKSLSMKGAVQMETFENSLGKYHGWCIYREMKIGNNKVSTWESPHWIVIGNVWENPELLK